MYPAGTFTIHAASGAQARTQSPYSQTQAVRSQIEPRPDPREKHDLCQKFASVFRRIIKIMNTLVDVEDLKDFLDLYCHPLYPEQNCIDPRVYRDAKTPRELLKSLSPQFINYMNYYILEGIVKEFGCDEGKQLLEEYKCTLKSKNQERKRKLEDLPDPVTDSEIEQSWRLKRIKVTLNEQMEEATFETMQDTQTALQAATGIDKANIVYASCDPGSVILNFLIPESICHVLHELSEEDLAILAVAGVLKLRIDEFVIENIQKYATNKSKISQSHQTQTSGEHAKPTSLEYYLQQRQNEMQPDQYSHLCEILGYIPNEKLNELCSDSFLSAYASDFSNWKKVAPYIGLHEWNIEELMDNYPTDEDRKHVVLQRWKRDEGHNATYHNLLETLILHGEVEDVKALLYQVGPGRLGIKVKLIIELILLSVPFSQNR